MMRLRARIVGQVQGVGFRPWVARRAALLGVDGWVRNGPDGVWLEAEGPAAEALLAEVSEAPRPIDAVVAEVIEVPERGEPGFRIAASAAEGAAVPTLPPDLATCAACLEEVGDPASRRYGYLLLSCAACGPRASIAAGPPFDRDRTAMRAFPLCDACLAEYRDPLDRRFHAQATACPDCGPHLSMPLDTAAAVVRGGGILAVQGLSGFQLVCDALDEAVVQRVRAVKRRPDKPLAVMVLHAPPGLTPTETAALHGPEAPVVVARRRATDPALAPSVLRDAGTVGWMLPSTALHGALLEAVGRPVVCTSANVSGEPLGASESEAGPLADATWSHDRPIWNRADDSVVREIGGAARVLRRARGYAPRPVPLGRSGPPLLAMGADLKSAVALGIDDRAVLSPYLGALGSRRMLERLEREVTALCEAWSAPELVVRDAHPDLVSSIVGQALAAERGIEVRTVDHHHAHVGAVCAEHGLDRPVLAFAWDGVGLGPDGGIWGGETLFVDGARYERVGHLHPFALPGGDACAREPGRTALALLHAAGIDPKAAGVDPAALHPRADELWALLDTVHPTCTAMGRLLDGLAVLAGVPEALGRHGPFRTTFEGQLPIALEGLAGIRSAKRYDLTDEWLDWRPWVEQVVADRSAGIPTAIVAARIHATLVGALVRSAGDAPDVVLCGGCFQNSLLVEGVMARLGPGRVWLGERVPANDGGIALGQAWVARRWGG
ncbi:MAG: carbamoyltransferase HypF [Alphaproteobacteria bacterium]|nr:carbamoyltransferase HypF [Alphaproteobacteria bacterium]